MNKTTQSSGKSGHHNQNKSRPNWATGQEPLATDDLEIHNLIREEKQRQGKTLELIASENFASRSISEAVSSCLTNKYCDGFANLKFYGATEMVDKVQDICQQRALELFDLDPKEWGVNVQAYSGSPANLAVMMGLLKPQDRIMGLDLIDGGHQSHGSTDASTSVVSMFYETLPYKLHPITNLIDYETLASNARLFRPKLIVAGTTTYSRLLDYKKFRQICDDVGAVLLADMAHICGLVAAKLLPSPFQYCDVVTTTTHKTLRGPKGALLFYRKSPRKFNENGRVDEYEFEEKINNALYPALQGGAHMHTIAGIAVALKLAKMPSFRLYQQQVLKNAKVMVKYFQEKGYDIVTGGTDNHLLVVDLKSKGIDGSNVETICDFCSIAVTRIHCSGDTYNDVPGGIRIGTPALTSRQLNEADFIQVASFLDRAIKIAIKVKQISDYKIIEFENTAQSNGEILQMMENLKDEIGEFLSQFPLPGFHNY